MAWIYFDFFHIGLNKLLNKQVNALVADAVWIVVESGASLQRKLS